MTNFGAYLNLYRDTNYRGTPATLRGATQNEALAKYPGGSWDKAASSLTTGESAWAELYDQPNFGGKVLRVGPNTTICNLSEVSIQNRNFNKAISSVRLFDARPEDWPGSSVSTRRYFTMSDVRRYSINKGAKSLTETVLGWIPYAGDVLSAIVGMMWPFGPDRADVWRDMNEWVSKLLEDMVTRVAAQMADNEIAGLAKLIFQYKASPTEENFARLYSHVLALEPTFTNPVDAPSVLPQITLFGTIALAIYRMAYFGYDTIYLSAPTQSDRDFKRQRLDDCIKALRASVAKGYQQALDRRLAKVKRRTDLAPPKPPMINHGGSFTLWDDYTHWSQTFKHDLDSQYRADLTYNYARSTADQIFAAEFDAYLEVADLWTYFDQPGDQTGKVTPKKEWRQVAMGPLGGFEQPFWSPNPPSDAREPKAWMGSLTPPPPTDDQFPNSDAPRDFYVKLGRGSKITSVTLYAEKAGDFMEGISFDVDGRPAAVWGRQGKASLRIDVAANERITGVFGAWGDLLHNVTIRKQAFTADGEAAAWATETGMGKDGGWGFSMSGPDGADAVLSGFFCQTAGAYKDRLNPKDKDRLAAFGAHWSYERTVPRK